ncbi:uncharacterized protein DS421_6g180590 [Arachis hypogaea]|nr:uncharacterized protein DS421_6g180590 [Arachis hypogaea]
MENSHWIVVVFVLELSSLQVRKEVITDLSGYFMDTSAFFCWGAMHKRSQRERHRTISFVYLCIRQQATGFTNQVSVRIDVLKEDDMMTTFGDNFKRRRHTRCH